MFGVMCESMLTMRSPTCVRQPTAMGLLFQTHAQRRSMEAEASQRALERNHERALSAVREEWKKKVLAVQFP